MSRRSNIICFSLMCIFISFHEIRKCQRFPFPSRFIYTAIAFICTDIMGMFAPQLATVVSVGIVAAGLVNPKGVVSHCGPWSPTGQPQLTAFLTATDTSGSEGPQGQASGQPPSEAFLTPPQGGQFV